MTPPLAQAGAWEAFLTEEHSRQWGVYDFNDETVSFPDWSAENEFISFVGGGNEPIWFFTTEEDYGGQNPFLGDYSASGIAAIRMEVYIEDPDQLNFIDMVVRVEGPDGPVDYYSDIWLGTDFEEPGWFFIRSPLDAGWYQLDGETNDWEPVEISSATWNSVIEIGVTFHPESDAEESIFAAIDQVILEPTVEAPPLVTSTESGVFTFTYSPAPATLYDIETYDETERSWVIVSGYQDLSGSEAGIFQTPIDHRGIFRVAARERLVPTQIPE